MLRRTLARHGRQTFKGMVFPDGKTTIKGLKELEGEQIFELAETICEKKWPGGRLGKNRREVLRRLVSSFRMPLSAFRKRRAGKTRAAAAAA